MQMNQTNRTDPNTMNESEPLKTPNYANEPNTQTGPSSMIDEKLANHFDRVASNYEMFAEDMDDELKGNEGLSFAVQTILVARRESKLAMAKVYRAAITVIGEGGTGKKEVPPDK